LKRVFLFTLALAAVACTDPVDKAAKARIFSPEEPPRVVASAGETLAADHLAEDAALERRVIEMAEDEITERIGAHALSAKVAFEWTAPNQQPVQLSEQRTLEAAQGGVDGDFHATVENSRDQGVEVIRHNGVVYARSRYMTFRERRRDRGMAERERDRIGGALHEVAGIFDNRVKLTQAGQTSFEGRPAIRYVVSLADKPMFTSEDPTAELPPQQDAKGLDPATAHRRQFTGHRQPVSLKGDLWVDAKTAVVLKAVVDGRLRVPAAKDAPAADLHLTLDESLSKVGQAITVAAPQDFLPDQDKPEGIADALDRFGVQREGKRQDADADEKEPADDE
jgi:hypothetical protein